MREQAVNRPSIGRGGRRVRTARRQLETRADNSRVPQWRLGGRTGDRAAGVHHRSARSWPIQSDPTARAPRSLRSRLTRALEALSLSSVSVHESFRQTGGRCPDVVFGATDDVGVDRLPPVGSVSLSLSLSLRVYYGGARDRMGRVRPARLSVRPSVRLSVSTHSLTHSLVSRC